MNQSSFRSIHTADAKVRAILRVVEDSARDASTRAQIATNQASSIDSLAEAATVIGTRTIAKNTRFKCLDLNYFSRGTAEK